MSKLFALHDQYHDKGLTVVGIHIDLGEGESERVDTAARLDERLAKTRRELWKGRDIPFLVALTSGQRTDFETGADGQAFNVLAAKYGIQSYPTYVLIDRKGNVVKKFALHDENIALLEKMLQEP
jgi:glutathione peroxidase-family protein